MEQLYIYNHTAMRVYNWFTGVSHPHATLGHTAISPLGQRIKIFNPHWNINHTRFFRNIIGWLLDILLLDIQILFLKNGQCIRNLLRHATFTLSSCLISLNSRGPHYWDTEQCQGCSEQFSKSNGRQPYCNCKMHYKKSMFRFWNLTSPEMPQQGSKVRRLLQNSCGVVADGDKLQSPPFRLVSQTRETKPCWAARRMWPCWESGMIWHVKNVRLLKFHHGADSARCAMACICTQKCRWSD